MRIFYSAVSKDNCSSIGYCRLKYQVTIGERKDTLILFPQFDYESHGLEDLRIVKIENLYYLIYTAYDRVNALGALASSKDLKQWEKKGIISPQISYAEFSQLAKPKEK